MENKAVNLNYYKKIVNLNYYKKIVIKGTSSLPPGKNLTEEEFKAGKQGIVWYDTKTGKITFMDKND